MSKRLLMRSLLAITVIFAIGLIGTTNETGGAPAVLSKDNPAVQVVIKAQDRHTAELMSVAGVVGTGTGLTQDGELAIIVYTKSDISQAVPKRMEGIPVRVKVTGEIIAYDHKPGHNPPEGGNQGGGNKGSGKKTDETARFDRPVPIGVSTGDELGCHAGTIGARVKDGGGNVYALSNNHVIADQNAASIGTLILQPGLFDTNCDFALDNVIGDLSDFQTIITDGVTPNEMDAAIAATTTSELDNATPPDGYGVPSSTTEAASIGQDVQKYGRTTNLTSGKVTALNVSVLVGFATGTAFFENQIVIESKKPFIKGGDSGSLVVTSTEANPIGLVFAGDQRGKLAVVNPIDPILGRFGVTIDGS